MNLIEQFIERIPIPGQIWHSDGTVMLTNVAFNRLFGLPSDFDWAAHKLTLRDDPHVMAVGMKGLIDRVLAGKPAELHFTNYIPAEHLRPHSSMKSPLQLFISACPLEHPETHKICVVCMVLDYVSGGTGYDEQLLRHQKMENIETLASGVAHEFNNIFTGIKGLSDLIKDESAGNPEIFDYAAGIELSIKRGAELVQNLTAYARQMPFTLKRMLVSQYLEQAISVFKLQIQKRAELEFVCETEGYLLIDQHRMNQALSSILLNAVDAAGSNGHIRFGASAVTREDVETLELATDTDWLRLDVEDDGPGIPPELLERVLEPFFTTKERGRATGLGLAVAKRIVVAHNGELQISRSQALGGAQVSVILPLQSQC